MLVSSFLVRLFQRYSYFTKNQLLHSKISAEVQNSGFITALDGYIWFIILAAALLRASYVQRSGVLL